jgi:PRTRC genetic system protein D
MTTDNTEILALDTGFGWSKGLTRRRHGLIPSLVGPAETIRFNTGLSRNGHARAVEVDGQWFFVGEQAEQQSAATRQTLDASRTGSLEQKALFYALAADLLRPADRNLALITGLPVGDFTDDHKQRLRRLMLGEHQLRRQGKHERRFTVSQLLIIPQAMGSLYAMVLDRHGRLGDTELASGSVAAIDIGTLTTNYVLCDRLQYIEPASDSIRVGISTALRHIARDWRDEFGLDWTQQLGKVDRALRTGQLELQGRPLDITDRVQPRLQAVAETIISHAHSLWGRGQELRAVIATGGGALLLAPFLEASFPHLRRVEGDPQLANVTGYLRIGLRRFG